MSLAGAGCSGKLGQAHLTNDVKIVLSSSPETVSEAAKRNIENALREQWEDCGRLEERYRDQGGECTLWEVAQETVEVIGKIREIQRVVREVEKFREVKKAMGKENDKGNEVEDRIQGVMEKIFKEKESLDGKKEQYEELSRLVSDKKCEIAGLCDSIQRKEQEFVDLSKKIEEIRGERLKRSEGIGGSYLARGSQGFKVGSVRERCRESREKAAKSIDTSKSKGSSASNPKSYIRQFPVKSLSDLQREKASLANQLLKATHELNLTRLQQNSPEQPTFRSLLKPNGLFIIYGMLLGISLLIITNLLPRA